MKLLVSLALLLIPALPTPAQSPPAWENFPRVQVPASAPAVREIGTRPVWRLDAGPEAEEVMGKIRSAAPGLNGRILLVDSQLTQVLVVGPQGEIESKLGRPGDGPGDLPGAYRAFQLPDGRIGVSGGAPALSFQMGGAGRIVLLEPDGTSAATWWAAGDPGTMPVSSLRELRCAGGHVLAATQRMEIHESRMVSVQELCLIDPADGNRRSLAARSFADDMRNTQVKEQDLYEVFAQGRCDISATGTAAFAPSRDDWQIVLMQVQGNGLVLERDFRLRPRSAEEKQAVYLSLGGTEDCQVLDTAPAVGRVRWRPDGNLWVEPGGLAPEPGVLACFDEFSPTGAFLGQVRIRGDADLQRDLLVFLEDGRLVWLRGFAKGDGEGPAGEISAEIVLLELVDSAGR